MGFGGISIWQLLIILAIIVLLFGTKKLRHIGADLGNAVKGFKRAVNDEKETDEINADNPDNAGNTSLHTENSAKATATTKERDKETSKDTAENNSHG